jgi:hypothetical protein
MYDPRTDAQSLCIPEELLPLQEILAEQVHDAWAAGRLEEGWTYGPELNQTLRTHPCLVPYNRLPESEKEYDRRTAAVTISCILDNGYTIRREHSSVQEAPSSNRYVMKKGAGGRKIDYDRMLTSATAVEWHGADGIRTPKEKNTIYQRGLPFFAAGRSYTSLKQLTAKRKPGTTSHWFLDCYGREVFHVWEGVPRFDCYDSGDERGFSWFFLCENNVLTRVFSSGSDKIYVTEDVAFLENGCWQEMEQYGFLK